MFFAQGLLSAQCEHLAVLCHCACVPCRLTFILEPPPLVSSLHPMHPAVCLLSGSILIGKSRPRQTQSLLIEVEVVVIILTRALL